MSLLNRIVAVTKDGITYKADPPHVDLISHSLGITHANSVASPGVKDPEPDYSIPKTNEPDLRPTLDHDHMQSSITIPTDEKPIETFIGKIAALSDSSGVKT